MTRCYIGLGSNQADPQAQVEAACAALGRIPDTRFVACSSLYRSAPMGPQDQPSYVNAVVALDTALTAEQLLDALQQIEQQQGRVRKAERWGPRTLDLDILLFGNQQISSPRLQVPHYHMHARAFVLYPLAELQPELQMPDGTPLQHLLNACPRGDLQTLAAFIQQPDAQTGLTPGG
ncbi:2-amino-4-hydroxy-6-hydroxymethyldihydropteridinediphosphokinase [Halopseudomonas sabulinigri]|uniref:2-amino-4-hydroxy-6-hydroxymethyldihydropteridine pyrophosphokinase n=1 Tax=Halopseudomonas sabulinigri TaxID=472181 RepID=A0A1H1W459_9GAMM|nr:2-amino-4-hydroxy-6-hydroxymethyldihydropteridine diphosphokinase [Halopseudomonas sabulinigri]SDS91835.1 2-amino-4-hydroxy-6-hydroxymethyldihydropteridinediphosphokinase [Halopseudomonas sabulinigri]